MKRMAWTLGPMLMFCLLILIFHVPPPRASAIRTSFLGEMNCVVAMGTYLVDHAPALDLETVIREKKPLPFALKDLRNDLGDHGFGLHYFAEKAHLVYGENEMFIAIAGPDGILGVPNDLRVYNPFDNMIWKRGDVYVRLTANDGKVTLHNPYPTRQELYDSLDKRFSSKMVKFLGG